MKILLGLKCLNIWDFMDQILTSLGYFGPKSQIISLVWHIIYIVYVFSRNSDCAVGDKFVIKLFLGQWTISKILQIQSKKWTGPVDFGFNSTCPIYCEFFLHNIYKVKLCNEIYLEIIGNVKTFKSQLTLNLTPHYT